VHAGKPVNEENFSREEIEGIPFYIRQDMVNKGFQIKWVGFWIFGNYTVTEL
jgi:hypothetical protein